MVVDILESNNFDCQLKSLQMNMKYVITGGVIGATVAFLVLNGCKSIPKGAKPVTNFKKDKYLGKWYEIARLDFKHERNLNNVTADYSLNDDQTIRVVNRGYNYKTRENEQAIGKAKFRGDETVGALKVSFFGPFYSGYNVLAIDENYQYALVAGKNLKYLWILSRTTSIPEDIKDEYLSIAKSIGYNTDDLVWVEHN